MESARPAELEDLPAIAAVADRIRDELAEGRGGPLFLAREACVAPIADRIRTLIDDPDGTAIVGCYDGIVLGYTLAEVETLADGRRLGRIDDLAVDPEARASGIGEAMMDLVLGTFRTAGCFGVDSRALPGDRQTKNFFESFGLKARLLIVHRSFDDDAPA